MLEWSPGSDVNVLSEAGEARISVGSGVFRVRVLGFLEVAGLSFKVDAERTYEVMSKGGSGLATPFRLFKGLNLRG